MLAFKRGVLAAVVAIGAAACARTVPVTDYGTPTPGATACEPTVVRIDTVPIVVYATTGYAPQASPTVREFRSAVLRSILSSYVPFERVAIPMFSQAMLQPATPGGEDKSPRPSFDAELVLSFRESGRLRDARAVGETDIPDLLPALHGAVMRADSSGRLPALVRDSAGALVTEVQIRIFGSGSTVPPPVDPSAVVFPLVEQSFEVARADTPARALAGFGAPSYPPARRGDRSGFVEVQFIVTADGQGDTQSVRTIAASHRDYATEVVKALPRMRFLPAQVGQCPVASWVRQRFEFRSDGFAPPA